MAADEGKVVVKGREYPVATRFTLGETRMVKRIIGRPWSEWDQIPPDDPDMLVAMVWVAMHREDPTVTVDDVDALEWDEFTFVGGEEESPPGQTSSADPSVSETPSNENGVAGTETPNPETTPLASGIPS